MVVQIIYTIVIVIVIVTNIQCKEYPTEDR